MERQLGIRNPQGFLDGADFLNRPGPLVVGGGIFLR